MTREEILKTAKPILFNTEMVRAILDGRKTMTRRVIKPKYRDDEYGFCVCKNKSTGRVTVEKMDEDEGTMFHDGNTRYVNPPYKPGQYLYVRETWAYGCCSNCDGDIDIGICSKRANRKEPIGCYFYRADGSTEWDDGKTHWRPSIHMPKDAARIFLRVTKVHCERLQEIDGQGVLKEGVNTLVHPEADYFNTNQREAFERLWNSTIKKQDLDQYGWDASPWVWVIEFERVEVDG